MVSHSRKNRKSHFCQLPQYPLEKSNNSKFWISKIARNRERDEEVNKKLVFMGWTVIRFWGKDIRKNVDKCVNVIEETIFEIKLERDEEIDFNDNLDL